MFRMRSFIFTALILILAVATSLEAAPQWIRQLGTDQLDFGGEASTDSLGNVYISGTTGGSLGGMTAGAQDAFLAKYDAAGALLWARQLGTEVNDASSGVSAGPLGNVYLTGSTYGSLGGPNSGSWDAYLAKYDAAGNLQWTEQLGSASRDISTSVSADLLGNVYIMGHTEGSLGGPVAVGQDVFLAKYDTAGSLQWAVQLGTDAIDYGLGISTGPLGNVYISGVTEGSLGGPNVGEEDAFLAKYDSAGALLWTQQLGSASRDTNSDVMADSLGNVYITGFTDGLLDGQSAGAADAYLAKYDAAGTLLWTEQLGSAGADRTSGIATDSLGNVYIAGSTDGHLGGPNAGPADAYLAKYDAAGTLLWTEQFGSADHDRTSGISADALGNVYVSGSTLGSLGGPNAGVYDAFLTKFAIPEPSTFALAAFGCAVVAAGRLRRPSGRARVATQPRVRPGAEEGAWPA